MATKTKSRTSVDLDGTSHILRVSRDRGAETDEEIRHAVNEQGSIILLPPDRFTPQPQPRTEFEEGSIEELALNIFDLNYRKRGIYSTGFLQPISVKLPEGVIDSRGQLKTLDFNFPITMGETRWRAGTMLATTGVLDKRESPQGVLRRIPDLLIPAYVSDLSEEEAFELGYYENKKRNALRPLDDANAILRIKLRHNLTMQGVADRIGEDIGYVQNRLDALKSQEDVQKMIVARPDSLSIGRRIDKLQSEDARKTAIKKVLDKVPKKEVEEYVNHVLTLEKPKKLNKQNSSTSYGSEPTKGVRTVSALDTESALDRMYEQAVSVLGALRNVPPSKSQKTKLTEKTVRTQEIFDQIHELLK